MRGTVAKRIRRGLKGRSLSVNDAEVKIHKAKMRVGEPVMQTGADGNPEMVQATVDVVTGVRKLNATSLKAMAKDVKRSYNNLNTQARANFLKG